MSTSINRPFQPDEVLDYEKKRYRGLDQRLVHWREEKIINRILDMIGKDLRSVGDIPCGYGRFSGHFLERGYFLVSGDLSLHMVSRALGKKRPCGKQAGFVVDLKEGLPVKTGTLDLIFSMRLFHHLHRQKDRKSVLAAFALASPRHIIISYYQQNAFHLLQRKLRRLVKSSKTRIKMISSKDFLEETSGAGLDIVKVFPVLRGVHAQRIALLKKSKN